VIGSPTQSTFSQVQGGFPIPQYQMPSEQDRYAATQQWRNDMEADQNGGKGRRRRPGVVFDLGPEYSANKTRPHTSQIYGGQ
jgi:hypothetical protein